MSTPWKHLLQLLVQDYSSGGHTHFIENSSPHDANLSEIQSTNWTWSKKVYFHTTTFIPHTHMQTTYKITLVGYSYMSSALQYLYSSKRHISFWLNTYNYCLYWRVLVASNNSHTHSIDSRMVTYCDYIMETSWRTAQKLRRCFQLVSMWTARNGQARRWVFHSFYTRQLNYMNL